jgi:PIN domain nuclease of toxin-antitoxin system
MPAVVADTHAIIWYVTDNPRLSQKAVAAMDAATAAGDPIYVSAISLIEVQYLVEKGRLAAEDQRLLLEAIDDANRPARLVPVDREIAEALKMVPRDEVPDMPDRIVAATAFLLGIPAISRDGKIRASQVQTIW